MKAAPAVLAGWGALLAGLTVGLLFFTTDVLALALLGGAAVAIVAFAALYALPARDEPRRLPELSYATVLASVGAATMMIGAGFGLWLILIGAGLFVLGLGGVARELRAERRRW